MITAHLPSGYIAYRASGQPGGLVFWACLLGAVFPDLDLLWFFFVDDRAFHHHRYWVHIPAFWLAISIIALPLILRLRATYRNALIAFLATWFVHLCLDSIVGSVMWLWPVSDRFFQLATVPATQSHYLLSFIFHWSFLCELAIWIAALALFIKRPKT